MYNKLRKNIFLVLLLVIGTVCPPAAYSADIVIPAGYILDVQDDSLELWEEDITNAGSITTSTGSIMLGGDWLNSGDFSSGSGAVALNSSAQDQSVTTGGTASAFSTITITNTHASGVTFTDALYCGTLTASSGVQKLSFGTSGVHTVSSNFNVDGSSGDRITLTSAGVPFHWNLDAPMTGNYWVNYLDVSYSNVISGKTIPAFDSVNGGNNINWSFGPIVTTGAATSVGNTSATLNGTVIPNGTATTVWFDYGQASGSYTGSSTTQTGLSGTETVNISINLSNLSEGTTYYARLAATYTDSTTDVPITWDIPPSGGGEPSGGTTVSSPTYISVNSTSPSSSATNVSADTSISATFSDSINGSTVSSNTFKVTKSGSSVSGSLITSGSTATFTPASALSYNKPSRQAYRRQTPHNHPLAPITHGALPPPRQQIPARHQEQLS